MKSKNTIPVRRTGVHNIFRVSQGGHINLFNEFVIGSLATLASYPSSIVEVFLRKKFGERYFTLSTCLIIFILLILYGLQLLTSIREVDIIKSIFVFAFAGIYLLQSIKHRKEITKYGTAYNFDRFSLSDGQINPLWWKIIGKEYLGIKINRYRVIVIFEPLVPILVGLFLSLIPYTRAVGIILFISGILFGFRAFTKVQNARNNILDTIDEQIIMKYKEDVLVEQKPMEETAGLSIPIEMPQNKALRQFISNELGRQMADASLWEDDENLE